MQTGGYPVSSSAEACQDTASLHVPLRPNLVYRDTDQILSYYQSDLADRPYDHDGREPRQLLSRHDSHDSRSSSEYSAESLREPRTSAPDPSPAPQASRSGHTRRPSVPTQEGADRRRLAIIEVDSSLPPSVSRRGSNGAARNSGVSSSSLLSRRGIHVNGLALVAPPDASPATYTNLTPPPTAPVFPGDRQGYIASSYTAHTHSRSASEAIGKPSHLRHQTSRDIGIVGTSAIPRIITMTSPSTPPNERYRSFMGSTGLEAPIFQTLGKSRSPSPGAFTPDLSTSTTTTQGESFFNTPTRKDEDPALTPGIGEGKDVRQPVVGPVIVDLDSDQVMRQPMHPINRGATTQSAQFDSQPASYLFYEPGVHSTAGPLPPPPTSLFEPSKSTSPAPPRPQRLRTPLPMSPAPAPPSSSSKRNLEALKESLQLPLSVSSKLASRAPSRAESRPDLTRSNTSTTVYSAHTDLSNDSHGSKASKLSGSALEAKRSRSIHRREGAFPPSSSSTTSPNDSPRIDSHEEKPTQTPDLPVVEPESDLDVDQDRRPAMELRRESSWISLHETNVGSSPNGKAQRLPDTGCISRSPSVRSPMLPPLPPPKTSKGPGPDESRSPTSTTNPFRATFNSLKRFSALPRTPSSLSVRSSQRGGSTPRTSRTPSPSYKPTPKIPSQPKVVNPNPAALIFRDVSVMKSPNERAEAYTLKIKELGMCDTGLSNWMISTIENGPKRRVSPNPRASPSVPSELGAKTQPRHVSNGSVDSEATFPRRADTYTATDLTMRADEVILPESPLISVPYPTLVTSPIMRAQTALPSAHQIYQVPLSSGPPRTGFFASIGRRASLRKGPISPPSSPSRVLRKAQHMSPPAPAARLVQISSAPMVKGGPRAPPHRISRSQTISVAPAPVPEQDVPQPVSITRSETMVSHRQSTSTNRRPSLFHRSVAPPPPPPSGADFERQVDKLADLLPHADRNILAGYLRRAGQDILAIGQYLEDEKNGTLRND